MIALASTVMMLVLWLLLGVLVATCIRSVWRATMLPRGAHRRPACEACGYDVSGLTTFTCPECGRDVRVSGIITPAMELRRRGSLLGAIVSWTVLVLGTGLTVWGALFVALESRAMVAATPVVATQTTPATPASGAYAGIDIAWTYDWQISAGTLVYTLRRTDGPTSILTIDTTTLRGSFDVTDADDPASETKTRVVAADAEGIGEWLAAAGVDVALPAVQTEAEDLRRIADVLASSPHTMTNSVRVSGLTLGAPTWATSPAGGAPITTATRADLAWRAAMFLAIPLVLLIVYAAGIVWIVRRRRRLLALAA